MKKITLLIFCALLFSSVSFSQDNFVSTDTTFARQSENWYFTNVINVDSTISKDKLYQTAKQWFSETFVSSKNVIDNADKDEGVIYGHALITFKNSTYGNVNFNIEIRCKRGKIKYVLNDFMHKDAYIVNVYGYTPAQYMTPDYQYSVGSLTQREMPEYLGYNKTGRSKKGRDEMWYIIRNISKMTAYDLIQNLKSSLSKESIKEKDKW